MTFSATPADGYYVADWAGVPAADWAGSSSSPCLSGEDHISETTCTARVVGNLFVTVTFAPSTRPRFRVSLIPASDGNVSARRTGDSNVENGEAVPGGATVYFTAHPHADHHLSGWLGDCEGRASPPVLFDPVGRICGLTVVADVTVGAKFLPLWEIRARASPPEGGSALIFYSSLLHPTRRVGDGQLYAVVATPENGYYVSGWSEPSCAEEIGGEDDLGEKTCALVATADLEVVVTFALARKFTVSFSPTENGTLSANRDNPDGGPALEVKDGDAVPRGVTVRFLAHPAAGYYVSGWTGACAGRAPGHAGAFGPSALMGCGILGVTMDVTVGAVFSRASRVWHSHSSGGGLRALGLKDGLPVPSGGGVEAGSTVRFTAEPEAGFYVSGWSDSRCPLGLETETGPAHPRVCELTAELDFFVTVTFAAGRTRQADADAAVSPQNRQPTLRAAAGYFGFAHAISVGTGLTLTGERFSGLDYDRAAEVISIRADNPVRAAATLTLAVTARVECAGCVAAELTVTLRVSPVSDPGQASLTAGFGLDFSHRVSLPSGFESGGTLTLLADAGGGFALDSSAAALVRGATGLASGNYAVSLGLTHSGFLGMVILRAGAEVGPDCAGVYNRLALAGEPLSCGECLPDFGDLNGHCVSERGALPENRATCREVFGGDWLGLGGVVGLPDDAVGICSGIDLNDTFCIADPASDAAFSCAGLFGHVRDCNLLYGRRALDAFHCAERCLSRRAAGARCLE